VRHRPALDDLTRLAFDDPAGHVRLAAIDALGRLGDPAAIPALAALAASEDAERSRSALHALGGIDHGDVWAPLQTALRADDDETRASAAAALGRLRAETAVELLEWTAAVDTSAIVVATAVRALASAAAEASQAARAVGALLALVADPSRRELVIAALGSLPSPLIETVARGLRDPRPAVRASAVQGLGRMRHPEASRSLQTALDDPAPEVRVAALTEFRHLGTRGLDRRLLALARADPDASVRHAALTALRGMQEQVNEGDAESESSRPAT
jgi:HEAT repeat protein